MTRPQTIEDLPPSGAGPPAAGDEPRGLELGAEPLATRPVEAPTAEVRFGLVLYGGVSLAIYIYGVVYEFWRLVQASQGARSNAYAKLLADAQVTAVVDIVSGTSAGGINGILLAKALTAGSDLRTVRSIWTDDANLEDLLRRRSEPEPRSLLRTDRFERLLADGLAAMDRPSAKPSPPLVRAFDLFVSTTRLRPWIRGFPTDLGGAIKTADFRKAFQLKHRVPGYNPADPDLGYSRADFAPDANQALVEIARATSAFPAAFEPRLIERDEQTQHLYRAGEPASSYFSDGGILHNKPFTEAIATIAGRASDVPVERWLVSVEPDPERFAPASTAEPAVDEVVAKAAFGIPRYQSVAADLDRLIELRARARRERGLLAGVDDRIATALATGAATVGEAAAGFAASPTYGAYRAERAYQLSSDFAAAIADAAGLDEPRERTVAEALQAGQQSTAEPGELADFSLPDLSFERRRIYHLLGRVADRRRTLADEPPALRGQVQVLWARFDALGAGLWLALNTGATGAQVAALHGLDGEALGSRALELVPALWQSLRALIPAADDDPAAEACAAIDELIGLGPAERLGNREVYDHYELWDQFVLPCDPALGVPARDDIRLARISPEDATHISKSPANKVAGDALHHFGGFLKREWRENDILWGRLDAAETIVRMLVAGRDFSPEQVDSQIEAVQREVIADELPEALPNYRRYLEATYGVGEEDLGDVPADERARLVVGAADVIRNIFRGLASAHQADQLALAYGWVGRVVGAVLFVLRWPVLAIWGEDSAIRRAMSLVILFIGAWSLVTLVLVLLDVIDATANLWGLIGLGALIYLAWSALLLFFGRRGSAP